MFRVPVPCDHVLSYAILSSICIVCSRHDNNGIMGDVYHGCSISQCRSGVHQTGNRSEYHLMFRSFSSLWSKKTLFAPSCTFNKLVGTLLEHQSAESKLNSFRITGFVSTPTKKYDVTGMTFSPRPLPLGQGS